MKLDNLQDKFIFNLGNIYDAEQRFLEAQQAQLQQADTPQLQTALQHHIEETQQQIRNLEQVFSLSGIAAQPAAPSQA